MRTAIGMVLLLFSLLSQSANSADFTAPAMPGLGGCIVMSAPSASDALLLPCGNSGGFGLTAEAYTYDRYQLGELKQDGAAAAISYDRNLLAIGVVQFGKAELYRETTERIAIGRNLGGIAIGASLTANTIDFGSYYSALHSYSLGLGSTLEVRSASVGLSVEQVNSPRMVNGGPRLTPRVSAYFETWPKRSYAILARCTKQEGQRTQYGAGQIVKLPYRSRLFWGISNEPIIYGAGLEFCVYKAFITCTMSYHPVLGLSRMITLSFRTDGRRTNN